MKAKRILSVIVALAMIIASMGTVALAADNGVAEVHSTQHQTLQSAIDAAQTGDTVKLLADITLTEGVTVPAGKTITLDLNGKTISGTHGTDYSMIHVLNGAELTVKDTTAEQNGKITCAADGNNTGAAVWVEGKLILESGTIEVTGKWTLGFAVDLRPNAWGTAHTVGAFFIMNGGTVNSTDTAVRIISNSSDSYTELGVTFTMNGGSIKSTWDGIFVQHLYAGDLNVNVVNGTVSGTNSAMRIFGDAGSDIDMSVTGGAFEGEIKVAEAYEDTDAIAISGGTFSSDVSDYLAEGCELTGDAKAGYTVEKNVAEVNGNKYATLQEAIDAAAKGDTVKLLADVELSKGIEIADDDKITLDLNGKTISQTKEQTGAYQMILNDGNLTIENSVGEGKISYTDSGNGGEYISDTIYNCGTLVINGGTIENLSSATVAQNGYPHAVDTYSGSRDTSVTINAGTIYCAEYSAIRMFCVSATKRADLVINDGTIKGAVDMQNGSSAAALGTLTINGGTFETTANANNIRFANWGGSTYGITASIDGGTFKGGISTAYVPAAANWDSKIISGGTFSSNVSEYVATGNTLVENEDGTYGIAEKAWATATDSGAYVDADDTTWGMMRFLFAYDIDASKIANSGIKYLKSSNITDSVTSGATVSGQSAAFFGDIVEIPNGQSGTYYAVAYIETTDGKVFWSAPLGCNPNFEKVFADYTPETAEVAE